MPRNTLPKDPADLDPNAPYDVRLEDLKGLPYGFSVRVSSKGQENNGSKDVQLRRIRTAAREAGLVFSGCEWGRTESGKYMAEAEETSEQLEAARAGRIRVIIFYDSSRYARNAWAAMDVERQFHAAGCFVVYVDTQQTIIASNTSTKSTKDRQHVDNEEYVIHLGRVVADNIEGMIVRGEEDPEVVSQAGIAAFGWYRPEGYTQPLRHSPEESRIVLEIAEHFLLPSENTETTAAWANSRGWVTRRGNAWIKQSIYDMLTLPLHRGVVAFHESRRAKKKGFLDGMSGRVEPIIPPSLAARIDAKLAEARRGRSSAVRESPSRRFIYTLGGLAVWQCGKQATQQYGGNTPHPRYHHPGTHEGCYPERHSYAQTEYIGHMSDFWNCFELTDDVISQVLDRLASTAPSTDEVRAQEFEIKRLEAALRKMSLAFAEPGSTISVEELVRLRDETERRVAELRENPAVVAERVNLLEAAALLRHMGSLWGTADESAIELEAARRDLMLAVFEEVTIWGPFVQSVTPRPEYRALVVAAAYRVRSPSLPQIEIRASRAWQARRPRARRPRAS